MTFFRPSELQPLVADARAGSFRAATRLATISQLIFGNSEKRRCLLCEARIRAGLGGKRLGMFAFLHASGNDLAETSTHLVCEDCVKRHQTSAALKTAIVAYYQLHFEVGDANFPTQSATSKPSVGSRLFEAARPEGAGSDV